MKWILILVSLTWFAALGQQNKPCNCCSEEYIAFDFWIGQWEVTTTNGDFAGKSTINREEDGCVIRENWTSAKTGYSGTSLNFFNKTTKKWEQLWVDNTGAFLKLTGNRKDNQMILSSDDFVRDGKSYRNRITWTKNEDGTVRQLWEVLQGEEVVNVAFDGLYKKE